MLHAKLHSDVRVYFCETYTKRHFESFGIDVEFVQDNLSYSAQSGTVRGLHFQSPPAAQAKLVRVQSGAVLDVAVMEAGTQVWEAVSGEPSQACAEWLRERA